MHVNIREELCYIELLHIFEWKNRNSEIVRRRGWQGLKADFSKPQVDTLVIESMCFFSTQAVFGQGWPNIKYSPLGEKGRHKQDLATICLGARSALPLRGEPSVPLWCEQFVSTSVLFPLDFLACILGLPHGNSSLGTLRREVRRPKTPLPPRYQL